MRHAVKTPKLNNKTPTTANITRQQNRTNGQLKFQSKHRETVTNHCFCGANTRSRLEVNLQRVSTSPPRPQLNNSLPSMPPELDVGPTFLTRLNPTHK